MTNKKQSGLLLHPTSLPSPFGIGDLGPEAYSFVDFLAQAKQTYWQMLPLTETSLEYHNSPYHGLSAFAGNPLLISPEILVQQSLLLPADLLPRPDFVPGQVDYGLSTVYKTRLMEKAYNNFKNSHHQEAYNFFCQDNAFWLNSFTLLKALKTKLKDEHWQDWQKNLRDRDQATLTEITRQLKEIIDREKFYQFLFYQQWGELKKYCHEKGIKIIGDLPIYLPADSAEVWQNPELFQLDGNKQPSFVSGVPPDYFSQTGQLWGHPVYNWSALKAEGFHWWVRRLDHNFKLFDLVRLDHFRGFVAYWQIKAGEKTAINGQWIEAPAKDFFTTLLKEFGSLSIIAEDLGVITPDVTEVMNQFSLPGMKIILFAFGDENDQHPYLPHTYPENCIAYTGTHDNNTVRGWFENEATKENKNRVFKYLGKEACTETINWEFINLLMTSRAKTVIIPVQDLLGLGQEARINTPGKPSGNWLWRLLPNQLNQQTAEKLTALTVDTERNQ